MARQTAVEWLYNHLFPKQLDGFSEEEWDKIDKAFKQAKQMEREQIKEAFDNGDHCIDLPDGGWEQKYKSADHYYNETYGK